jgi:hypothetical protein
MPKGGALHFKTNSVRRGVEAARKAGLIVTGFDIEPDGALRFHTAPAGQLPSVQDDPNVNEWEAKYGKPAA